MTAGEENTIRIFNREKSSQITSVLPIPTINNKSQILSIAYCRTSNTLYVLIDNLDIWVYYTKYKFIPFTNLVVNFCNNTIVSRTYPCTKVSIWNTNDIQKATNESDDEITVESQFKSDSRRPNYLVVQGLVKNHRAIEIGLVNFRANEMPMCRCIAVLESSVVYWNIEGQCSPFVQKFLLLGLEVNS